MVYVFRPQPRKRSWWQRQISEEIKLVVLALAVVLFVTWFFAMRNEVRDLQHASRSAQAAVERSEYRFATFHTVMDAHTSVR